ncbi:MAG: trypsin-like peptidase domain-containing protein [Bacteroidetes bacterium]|nr:trypsin-like peptidase domain-containing protein [Bacteroidota bacterium]
MNRIVKKNQHKTISFLLLFLFFSCYGYGQEQLPELVKSVKPAVFKIIRYDAMGYESGGTGFFIEEKGICVTAYHVLENSSQIVIETLDESKYDFDSIIAADKKTDIVKFKIKNPKGKKFSFLKITEEPPQEGESVFMIGNPSGYDFSVTSGIVSAIRNKEHGQSIQTTAPCGEGSSGSPLMNMKGEVVGVMSYVKFLTQNMSFASSANQLKELKDDGSLRLGKTNIIPLSAHKIDNIIDETDNLIKNRQYDSALTALFPLLKYNLTEMQQIKIMWRSGSCYYLKRDYQNAYAFFDRTIDLLFKKTGKTPEMVFIYAESLHKAGMCQFYIGLKEDALETIEKSIEVSKAGYENDLIRRELYISMFQIGYYSLGAIKLQLGDTGTACLNFKLSKQWGYDKVEHEIKEFCK